MLVGLIQSVEGLNRIKRWRRAEFVPFYLPAYLSDLGHQFSLALDLRFIPAAPLVLRPLYSDWNYTIGTPGSPACRWQVIGLLDLCNCVSQFLLRNQSLSSVYIYIHIYMYLSIEREIRWRTLTSRLIHLIKTWIGFHAESKSPSKCWQHFLDSSISISGLRCVCVGSTLESASFTLL